MRGAVIPTSAHQGIPTTFALRRGITVPRYLCVSFKPHGNCGGTTTRWK